MIISIGGKDLAGKDTSAIYIKKVLELYNISSTIKSLAKPIKDIAKIFGFTEEQLYNPESKQTIDKFWDITPRKFMQLVGTDLFRDNFRDDVWLKLMENTIINTNGKLIIIPDIRFKNELNLIKKYNGISIYIDNDNNTLKNEESNHVSETQLKKEDFNYIVKNDIFDDNFANLHKQLNKVLWENF